MRLRIQFLGEYSLRIRECGNRAHPVSCSLWDIGTYKSWYCNRRRNNDFNLSGSRKIISLSLPAEKSIAKLLKTHKSGNDMPAVIGIDHIYITVSNLQRATKFSDPDGIRLEITNYRQERRQRHDEWEQIFP